MALDHSGGRRGDVAECRADVGQHAQPHRGGDDRLSSFVQSGGYLVAGIGPVAVGYLHVATVSWIAPCWFMAAAGLVAASAAIFALRPVFIEDA